VTLSKFCFCADLIRENEKLIHVKSQVWFLSLLSIYCIGCETITIKHCGSLDRYKNCVLQRWSQKKQLSRFQGSLTNYSSVITKLCNIKQDILQCQKRQD